MSMCPSFSAGLLLPAIAGRDQHIATGQPGRDRMCRALPLADGRARPSRVDLMASGPALTSRRDNPPDTARNKPETRRQKMRHPAENNGGISARVDGNLAMRVSSPPSINKGGRIDPALPGYMFMLLTMSMGLFAGRGLLKATRIISHVTSGSPMRAPAPL